MDLCDVLMLQPFELIHKGDVLIGALVVSDVVLLMVEDVFIWWLFQAIDVQFIEVAVLGRLEEL